MKLLRPVLQLMLLCTTLALLGGWGRDGHAIIAQIAWEQLSGEAKAEIEKLLGESSLPEIASWADVVRREPAYEWSAPLHYVNMPPDAADYDPDRDCPPEGNVVSAIDRFAAELKDRTLPAKQRGEALMFLVHFVGDLHQPLHGGRAEDRGGNSIQLTFYDKDMNLHAVWDYGILEADANDPWPVRGERLLGEITDMDRVAWLADTHVSDLSATAGRWAVESHILAEKYCYCVEPGSSIGEAYAKASAPIAELRLKQAGIRLAAILEDCLGPGSAD
ncbi:MAG: S1/P1 nuclease [Phycisphaerales bacterium]|nr:S1/P1 nuclease [Phycisphaerales bacterium]MCB9836779.1 S1/P1 nuclease [Phycisphaera sp.]